MQHHHRSSLASLISNNFGFLAVRLIDTTRGAQLGQQTKPCSTFDIRLQNKEPPKKTNNTPFQIQTQRTLQPSDESIENPRPILAASRQLSSSTSPLFLRSPYSNNRSCTNSAFRLDAVPRSSCSHLLLTSISADLLAPPHFVVCTTNKALSFKMDTLRSVAKYVLSPSPNKDFSTSSEPEAHLKSSAQLPLPPLPPPPSVSCDPTNTSKILPPPSSTFSPRGTPLQSIQSKKPRVPLPASRAPSRKTSLASIKSPQAETKSPRPANTSPLPLRTAATPKGLNQVSHPHCLFLSSPIITVTKHNHPPSLQTILPVEDLTALPLRQTQLPPWLLRGLEKWVSAARELATQAKWSRTLNRTVATTRRLAKPS